MPHRIIGTEKCTHKNKETGLQDCNKLGRFNHDKPMVSWNPNDKTGKKRYYYQFIHNDGTRHNIESFEQYRLNQMKGHQFEDLFRGLTTLARVFNDGGNLFFKIAEASLKWNVTEIEERFLVDSLRQGDFQPIIKKYNEYEHKRRRQIYDDSQKAIEEKYRSYGTLEFQEPQESQEVDRIARNLFNLALLGLSREDLKLILNKLTEEQFIKVYDMFNKLINAYEKWLYDRRELIKEVAREKFNGKLPPEFERKMSARH